MAQVTLNQFAAQIHDDKDVFGKMDPYFIVFANGRQVFRSSVLPGGGTNPRWNDTFALQLSGQEQVEFRIYDRDTFVDDSVGRGVIAASQLMSPGFKQVPIQSMLNRGVLTFNCVPMGGMGGFGGQMGGMGGFGGQMGGMGGYGGQMGGMGGYGGPMGGYRY